MTRPAVFQFLTIDAGLPCPDAHFRCESHRFVTILRCFVCIDTGWYVRATRGWWSFASLYLLHSCSALPPRDDMVLGVNLPLSACHALAY
jgi:hypothetical protein